MKSKKINPYTVPLDLEEQEILKSFENNEWVPVDNFAEQALIARQAASNHFEHDI